MKCENCGNILEENTGVCNFCKKNIIEQLKQEYGENNVIVNEKNEEFNETKNIKIQQNSQVSNNNISSKQNKSKVIKWLKKHWWEDFDGISMFIGIAWLLIGGFGSVFIGLCAVKIGIVEEMADVAIPLVSIVWVIFLIIFIPYFRDALNIKTNIYNTSTYKYSNYSSNSSNSSTYEPSNYDLNKTKSGCPNCGSNRARKMFSFERGWVDGGPLGTVGKQYICDDCKHMW